MDKVEDERIWVTDLDTVKDLEEEVFEYVEYAVNLSAWCDTQWSLENRYSHIPIPDGGEDYNGEPANYSDFGLACDFVWKLLQRLEKGHILIHCNAGVSRSVTVASAVLARKNNTLVRDEIQNVKEATGKALDPASKNIKFAERWVSESS